MTEREQFEVEFVKLNYQWSDANKDKAFLGWQMARAQPAQAGPITSETGNAPDQGASAITSESGKAGQVLTDDQWQRIADITQTILTRDIRDEIEVVLAKRVPMTPEETDAAMKLLFYPARNRAFIDGIKAAERHHGIVGEKGGA